MKKVNDIIEFLMPFLIEAGSYSVAVQGRVDVHQAKGGPTAFHQALSDADLTIQGFLEVPLLARFPEVSFFSEEQSQSLNAKYFPASSELEVLLDPIDGTRAYIAQRAHYQIIVTIHDRHQIVGAVCYMPRLNRCYAATKGGGTFVKTHDECRRGAPGIPVDVTKSSGPVLVFNRPDLVQRLSGQCIVKDLATEFDLPDSNGAFYSTDLLACRASCVISAPAQAIDGGALAFIALEAGAVVSDENGAELGSFRTSTERILPCVVASANTTVHHTVLRLLAGTSV
jgi:myo-inositol-1(or 4)-monophosphatase